MIILLVTAVLLSHSDVRGHVLTFKLQNNCPGNVCPHDNTCCDTRRGFYACCPLPKATCCKDGATCCPTGYTCSNTQPTTCTMPDRPTVIGSQLLHATVNQKRLMFLKKINFVRDIPANGKAERFVKAFAANRRDERISRVSTSSNEMTGVLNNLVATASEIGEGLNICGTSVCVENHPCCNWTTQAMCCLFSYGVCCKDQYHCCPHQYLCDNTEKRCIPVHLTEDNDNKLASNVFGGGGGTQKSEGIS